MMLLLLLSRFSRVRLCEAPETAAHQAKQSFPLALAPVRAPGCPLLPRGAYPGGLPSSGQGSYGEGGALTWFCLELRSGERLLFRRQSLWRRSPGLQSRAGTSNPEQ